MFLMTLLAIKVNLIRIYLVYTTLLGLKSPTISQQSDSERERAKDRGRKGKKEERISKGERERKKDGVFKRV